MIKRSFFVFLCLALPFLASAASAHVKEDTGRIADIFVDSSSSATDTAEVYNVPTVTLDDIESNDEGSNDQGISPILSAGRDPFVSAASFNFSIARFRIRGYDNDYFETYMNGIPTEYIDNGFSSYNLWAGLNDMTRNRENSIGLRPTTFSYGSIGGVYSIDSRAAKQRKQLSVTIGTSNRTYDLRGGVSYGSGITKKGWSFAVSLFGRWAKTGYQKGTAMQSISYFASIQKFFGKHSLALTAFGVPIKQGKASPTTMEAYDLAGSHYYNPNWGYQDGKIRSSRIEYRHQPTMILTYEVKPTDRSNLMVAAGYSFGERSLSGFDRFDAEDPRPDYYKHLPSYYSDSGQEQIRATLEQQIQDNPGLLQINWDRLYDENFNEKDTTINDVNGVAGNSVTGKRAHVILKDDVQKYQRFNFNAVYNHNVKNFDLTAGLTYQFQMAKNFKRVRDLLGGDFFLDVDDFTADDSLFTNPAAANNDLNNPNRVVKVGDKYGYNYASVVHKGSVWGQINQHLKHLDWFVAAQYTYTAMWRIGYYKNGLSPTTSEGKSNVYQYHDYAVKGGLTYKITGRHYLYANGSYDTKAPFWDNLFISSRTRNIANGAPSEKIGSVEAGYIFNSPRVKLRATGFFSDFRDGSNELIYFDDDFFGLASYTITNINRRHFGGELGVEGQIYKGLSASLVASVGKYYYTSDQVGTLTIDNQPDLLLQETVYSKNFYVPNIPQQAYTLGLNYRSKKFWYVGLNVNFFDRFYTEFAPTHRTTRATDVVPYQSDQWYAIVNQERYNKKGQWTLDMSGGYSWRLKSTFKNMNGKNAGKYYLVLNAGLSNLTNNKNFIVSGREQLRFDYLEKDPNKFPTKYSYAYGINFYVNLTFRM